MIKVYWILFALSAFGTATSGHRRKGDRECWPLRVDQDQDSIVCVCDGKYCDYSTFELPPYSQYLTVTSNRDGKRFEKNFGDLEDITDVKDDCYNINLDLKRRRLKLKINPSKTFQKMVGFGGAFTDAAGINLACLSPDVQENLLRSYFTADGLHYNMGRVPIGGTDFSTRPYSYDDVDDDPELKHFSLQKEDFKYKIPFIKRATKMASKLQLFAAAWSPPTFMKQKDTFVGKSQLNKTYQQSYANYHIRFLEEYKKHGIYFYAISPGNEPSNGLYSVSDFVNSVGWLPDDLAHWIINYFGPAIRNSEFNDTNIVLLDDSRQNTIVYLQSMLKHKELLSFSNKLAMHAYIDGTVSAKPLEKILKKNPGLTVYTTEMSVGTMEQKIKLGSWSRADIYADKIIEELTHHSSAFIDWNLVLNAYKGGPTWTNNTIDAPIFADCPNNRFFKQTSYYAIGHFSKHIPPGSYRVDTVETSRSDLHSAAFLRPDGYVTVVLHNSHNHTVHATVEDEEMGAMNLKLTPKSITTIIY